MRVHILLPLLMVVTTMAAQQPAPPPLIKENATMKISEHVYVIPDDSVPAVPNVGIIVGSKATLVVDTGLGPRNGQTVAREVAKVSKNSELYLVATHFHSEHALGEAGFPATAKIIRARAQQADMDQFGIAPDFSTRSPVHAELMKDAKYRPAGELFDTERILDLGGLRVRLLWYGGTHTNGDTLVFVEGDRVLLAGDVVMNRRYLAFNSAASSVRAWISVLDKLSPLAPTRIVPSHGEMGDGTLIETNRAYLKDLQTRVSALKREGKTLEDTTAAVTTELRQKYPNWTGSPAAAIQSAFKEAS